MMISLFEDIFLLFLGLLKQHAVEVCIYCALQKFSLCKIGIVSLDLFVNG